MRVRSCFNTGMQTNVPKGGDKMTPNDLAAKLAGKANAEKVGKTFVRPLLRRYFPRPNDAKGTSWTLTNEQIAIVTAAYKARKEGKTYDVANAIAAKRKRKPKAPANA